MYDIRNLNIWKDNGESDLFRCKCKVLESVTPKRNVIVVGEKGREVLNEILSLVPAADLMEIRRKRGGRLIFPMYFNEKLRTTGIDALELSMRSGNCLHRAGYQTIGSLVEGISSSEDLKRIRNCGAKSVDEIMEQLFCFQYGMLERGQKVKYIQRMLELNREQLKQDSI